MKMIEYRKIAPAINADLKATLAKHGFNVSRMSASVSELDGTVRFKIDAADANLKDANGVKTTPEAERFKLNADIFGMPLTWLGAKFVANGRGYTLVGMRETRSRKCLVVTSDDGRTFHASIDLVKRNLRDVA